MTLDTRWEDIDKLLDTTTRTKDESREKAVHGVAAARFKFPTVEYAAYRTHVNVPDISMAVQLGGVELVPDIVVVEKPNTTETRLVMTAQVATKDLVNETEARHRWARFASVPDQAFYLYVPVGYGKRAKQLCRAAGVEVAGFRTWRWTPRGFEVNDISEPSSPLAALMPPIVRKLLATP